MSALNSFNNSKSCALTKNHSLIHKTPNFPKNSFANQRIKIETISKLGTECRSLCKKWRF